MQKFFKLTCLLRLTFPREIKFGTMLKVFLHVSAIIVTSYKRVHEYENRDKKVGVYNDEIADGLRPTNLQIFSHYLNNLGLK